MLDIYVGFMDEEVSGTLTHVVDHAVERNRTVLVIERGRVGGTIFERHIRSYGTDRGRFVLNAVYGGRVDGLAEDVQQEALSRAIDDQFDAKFLETLRPEYDTSTASKTRVLVLGQAGTTEEVAPLFSVLRFVPVSARVETPPNDREATDPIVVIRSPEMGLQPDLTRTFLRAVFAALLGGLGSGKDFRVKIYGAGGAIDAGDSPGTLHDISGSVYVGSRSEQGAAAAEESPVFRGVVSFLGYREDSLGCERAFTRHDLYESAAYSGNHARQKAEQDARAAFAFLCGAAGAEEKWRSTAKHLDNTRDTATLRDEIRRVCSKKVSLTASFFVGTELKSLARKLGLHDANMEDFHVLEVLESLPKFGGGALRSVDLVRVDCDPPEIPPAVEALFGAWTRTTKYARETYLAALRWGLFGAQIAHLEDAAQSRRKKSFHWSWVDQKAVREQFRELFYPPSDGGAGRSYVLDPFFVEIATDFLAYVKDGKVYGDPVPQAYRLKPDAAKRLKRRAQELLRVYAKLQSGQPAGFLNGELEDLLTTIFANDNYVAGRCPLIAAGDGYEIWVRPGSWDRNTSVLASELKASGAIVDRALYKSANQAALQDHAKAQLMTD